MNEVSDGDSEENMEEDSGEEKENRETIYLTKEYLESGDVEDSEEREIATHSPARIVRCRDMENKQTSNHTQEQLQPMWETLGRPGRCQS